MLLYYLWKWWRLGDHSKIRKKKKEKNQFGMKLREKGLQRKLNNFFVILHTLSQRMGGRINKGKLPEKCNSWVVTQQKFCGCFFWIQPMMSRINTSSLRFFPKKRKIERIFFKSHIIMESPSFCLVIHHHQATVYHVPLFE